MYFVGIDISKFKHDCAVLGEAGGLIMPSWSPKSEETPAVWV